MDSGAVRRGRVCEVNQGVVRAAFVSVCILGGCGGDPDVQPHAVRSTDAPAEPHHAMIESADPLCDECDVWLRPMVTLGSDDDLELLRRFPQHVARDSRGYVYALVARRDHEVLVYDPNGSQRRILGRFGEGPGEYRTPIALAVGPGDSLYLVHDRNRMSVFGPEGEFARSYLIPGVIRDNFLILSDGKVLMPGLAAHPEPVEASLHLLSRGGRWLHSFGDAPLVVTPGGAVSLSRLARLVFKGDNPGLFWVTSPSLAPRTAETDPIPHLRLAQMDTLGRPYWSVDIRPPDGTALESDQVNVVGMGAGTRELLAEVGAERIAMGESGTIRLGFTAGEMRIFAPTGVSGRGDGDLLVISRFLPLGWQDQPIEWERPGPGQLYLSDENLPHLYSTLVDVIDPESGTLLIRRIVPGYGQMLNDGTLAMMKVSEEGIFQIELFELEIDEVPEEIRAGAAAVTRGPPDGSG